MSAPTPRRATPLPQPSATPSPFTQSTPPPAALPSRYPQPRWRRFSSLLVADGGNSDDESDGDDSDEDDLDALPLRARDEHNDEGGRRSHFQFRHTSSGMDGTSSDSDFTDGANGSGKNSGDDAMSGGFSLSNAGTPGTASSGSGRDAGLSFFGSSPNSSGQAGAHFSRRLRPHQRVRPSLHRASSRNRPSPIQTTTMGANFHFGRLPISPTHQNDAMMVEGSASGLPTPRRASTAGLRGLSRIATILKEESEPFQAELAHENATTSFLKLATPLIEKTRLMPSDSRRSSLDADAFGESAQSFVETLEAIDPDVPLPRSIPLTNFQIKDPSSYISHSSKLNPENNFASRYQEAMSSPSLSPIIYPMSGSPGFSERKGKRKQSFDDRFEPYKRNRFPSSPVQMAERNPHAAMSPTTLPASAMLMSTSPAPNSSLAMYFGSGGSGNSGGTSTPPPPPPPWGFSVPATGSSSSSSSAPTSASSSSLPIAGSYFPMTRPRSASGSSVGSAMSMDRLPPMLGATLSNAGSVLQQESTQIQGGAVAMPALLAAQGILRPGSPRIGVVLSPMQPVSPSPKPAMGQMLNMTGAQGDLQKLRLG